MAPQPIQSQSPPSALVQLSFKPGIQRDGTKFQGDYCSDGFWVRFQSGRIKKIRGMVGIDVNTNQTEASEIVLVPTNDNEIFYYICSSDGVVGGTVDDSFTSTSDAIGFLINDNSHLHWQTEKVIKDEKSHIVFLANNNASDITQSSSGPLIYYGLPKAQPLIFLNNEAVNINELSNGGMCYSHPLLFLYGSNGKVQYSRNNNPLSFIKDETAETAGELTISSDKVIYGRPIRGGSNSPSVLFWTLSTVVRILNVGTEKPDFQVDVISKSSSILSSKCVVESDGFFYWPGTDRFFVYNGLARNLPNNTNLNYFFDNIDMDFRQKIFGVKASSRYGEIWWFYPEKVGAPLRNPLLPKGANSRAIIYNTIDDCWYDTAISRDCGTYIEGLGYAVTYGRSLTNPTFNNDQTFLWRHEYGTNEYIPHVLNSPIASSITTPIFGWSSFNPTYNIIPGQKAQLLDRWIEISRIEPDLKVEDDRAGMSVTVNTQKYAQSSVNFSIPFVFDKETEKIDMRVHGRQMSLTFSSGDYFEMGNFIMLLRVGDGQ